jgi:hypothetical protein
MVKDIPYIDHSDKLCEGCVLGNHPRNYFPKEASYRAKKVLELVHTDIYGSITPNSLDKHRYFITFRGLFSKNSGIFFKGEI